MPRMNRIVLIPIDCGKDSLAHETIDWVGGALLHSGDTAVLLHVVGPELGTVYGADVLGLASSDSLADAQAAASAHAKHYLDELAKGLPAGIEHQTAVFVYGSDLEDVGHAIIAYAQKIHAHMIVAMRSGRSKVMEVFVGSCTAHLVAKSPIPVIVITHKP